MEVCYCYYPTYKARHELITLKESLSKWCKTNAIHCTLFLLWDHIRWVVHHDASSVSADNDRLCNSFVYVLEMDGYVYLKSWFLKYIRNEWMKKVFIHILNKNSSHCLIWIKITKNLANGVMVLLILLLLILT